MGQTVEFHREFKRTYALTDLGEALMYQTFETCRSGICSRLTKAWWLNSGSSNSTGLFLYLFEIDRSK